MAVPRMERENFHPTEKQHIPRHENRIYLFRSSGSFRFAIASECVRARKISIGKSPFRIRLASKFQFGERIYFPSGVAHARPD